MFATGVTMGLAEWIIDDTCLVSHDFEKSGRTDDMCEIVISTGSDCGLTS